MKRSMLAFLMLSLPIIAYTQPYCVRQTNVDPEVPAGMAGAYDLIGKDPRTGRPYAGRLHIQIGKTAYLLTRTVGGKRVRGEAWMEYCGPDKIPHLAVRFQTRPARLDMSCRIGYDGDNYLRMTCLTAYDGQEKHTTQGREAWFQDH